MNPNLQNVTWEPKFKPKFHNAVVFLKIILDVQWEMRQGFIIKDQEKLS